MFENNTGLPQVQVVRTFKEIVLMQLPSILTSLGSILSVILAFVKLKRNQEVIQQTNKETAEKVASKVEAAATKVETVSKQQTDKILAVAGQTHMLVNGQTTRTLSLYATTARALAEATKNPAHMRAADMAEKDLAAHKTKEAVITQVIKENGHTAPAEAVIEVEHLSPPNK